MIAIELRNLAAPGVVRWCVFDITTLGGATGNASVLERLLDE